MKRKSLIPVLALLAAGAIITGPTVSHAQGTQTQQSDQPAPATNFSDSQLEDYADAAVEVRDLNVKWQKRAQESSDPAEVQTIRQKASTEMVQAIRDEGLSVEEYNQITQAALQDAELSERINSFIE
ncbi:DUF4168 domain-containing protein [Thalassospira australica]|uniref:DUF4168 domain-containing protein n=1 Tax=Thalassospira australica TaxID=1528106 RepID=UPI00384E32CB